MKECNKCDTAPQFLFPSASSRAAASVTTALRKRHMLHFRPLPLHSVTLRVTLPEPRNSFQTLASRRNVTLSREKHRYPCRNRFSVLTAAPRVSDPLPPCCLASSSCECVPVLGAFESRFAAFAGNAAFRIGAGRTREGLGKRFSLLWREPASHLSVRRPLAAAPTNAPAGRTRRCNGALPQTPWHETRESYRNQKEGIHEQGYRFQHPHFQ